MANAVALHAGAALRARLAPSGGAATPSATKPAISASFSATAPVCTAAPAPTRTPWSSAAAAMAAVAATRGGSATWAKAPRYASKPRAAAAIGAVKPARSEIQPATKPAPGCTAAARNAYSPPERWMRRASAP